MQNEDQTPTARLAAARADQDRTRTERDGAQGTGRELSAAVNHQAAETEVQAREAWLRYIDRPDGV